ncbi:hypothetical protein GCM10010468_32830 [Actinocorallia longicatena]|uniref:Uncharacterized protein n=1 Tax=Actinocorallia longicatena TaxID=111803 RepID=A0ABP6Q9H8_9ACTN
MENLRISSGRLGDAVWKRIRRRRLGGGQTGGEPEENLWAACERPGDGRGYPQGLPQTVSPFWDDSRGQRAAEVENLRRTGGQPGDRWGTCGDDEPSAHSPAGYPHPAAHSDGGENSASELREHRFSTVSTVPKTMTAPCLTKENDSEPTRALGINLPDEPTFKTLNDRRRVP